MDGINKVHTVSTDPETLSQLLDRLQPGLPRTNFVGVCVCVCVCGGGGGMEPGGREEGMWAQVLVCVCVCVCVCVFLWKFMHIAKNAQIAYTLIHVCIQKKYAMKTMVKFSA